MFIEWVIYFWLQCLRLGILLIFWGVRWSKVLSLSTNVLRFLNFPYLHLAPCSVVAVLSSHPPPPFLLHKPWGPLPYTASTSGFRLLQKCCPGLLVWAKEGWRNNWKKEGRERGEWANHKSPPQGHRKRACSFSHSIIFSTSLVFLSCREARVYIVRKRFSGCRKLLFQNQKPQTLGKLRT